MEQLRRLSTPVRLALVRLRSAPGGAALVAVGIGGGAALLAAVLALSLVARDRSLARSLGEIPATERSLRAAWFGVPGQGDELPALDRRARGALREVLPRAPTGLVLFRESTIGGRFVGLAGAEGLARWVRLRSGRLPAECRPQRCEVVRIGRVAGPLPEPERLRFVVVGEGSLRSPLLFGDFLDPAENAAAELSPLVRQARYHRPAPPPFLLAEGVATLAAAPALTRTYRSYSWVVPLNRGLVHAWEADAFARRVDRARSSLEDASSSFEVTAPIEEIRTAAATGRVAARRLLVLAGEAAALLLAFAVLVAAAARRDEERWRTRLTWLGARRWQLELFAAAGAAAVAVAAVAAGWLLGAGVGTALAAAEGVPAAEALARSALAPEALWGAGALAALAAAVLLLAARPAGAEGDTGPRVRPLDVAAAGAVAVLALGLARGAADPDRLGRSGTGAFLLLLPPLAAFVAAVVAARALPPILRILARTAPRGRPAVRLALLSLASAPGRAAVAVGFLTVSLGLGLFAVAYRTTLLQGQRDQAAFAVPLDFRVREDLTRLVPVADVASAAVLGRLRAHGDVVPVLRRQASIARLGGATGITVLGIGPGALRRLDGWRSDFARSPPDALAAAIRLPVAVAGARLPRTAGTLSVRATGARVRLDATVLAPDGVAEPIRLGDAAPRGATLTARIPPSARGGLLVGLTLSPVTRLVERGADSGRSLEGTLRLGPLRAGGREVTAYDGWIGENGVEQAGRGVLTYVLASGVTTRIRARQPTDGRAVPAIVSPAVAAGAARDGILPLRVGGEDVRFRVAGIARRVPGIRGELVVADLAAVTAALTAARPGTARVSELWVAARSGADAAALARELARSPYDLLAVESRRAVAASLATDPLASSALATLAAAAAAALALAVAGLLLVVVSELRDERGELFDLEAQGAEPRDLRRQVRLRAAVVAAAGLAAGAVAGAAISRLVVGVVAVTANAGTPDPPLRAAVGLPLVLAGVAVYALLVALLTGAATRRAFPAAGVPGRAGGEAA